MTLTARGKGVSGQGNPLQTGDTDFAATSTSTGYQEEIRGRRRGGANQHATALHGCCNEETCVESSFVYEDATEQRRSTPAKRGEGV